MLNAHRKRSELEESVVWLLSRLFAGHLSEVCTCLSGKWERLQVLVRATQIRLEASACILKKHSDLLRTQSLPLQWVVIGILLCILALAPSPRSRDAGTGNRHDRCEAAGLSVWRPGDLVHPPRAALRHQLAHAACARPCFERPRILAEEGSVCQHAPLRRRRQNDSIWLGEGIATQGDGWLSGRMAGWSVG